MRIEYLFGFFVVMLLLTSCTTQIINDKSALDNLISVSGNGELKVKPDRAEVNMAIITKAESAKIAQDRNAEAAQKIYQSLKNYVNKEDISTENYNLYRESKWNEKTQEYIEGDYVLTNSLKIVVKKLDDVGAVLDKVIEGGANSLGGVYYTLSEEKEKETKQKVLSLSATNAKEKAVDLAESLGVSVGKVKSIQETSYVFTPYYNRAFDMMSKADMAPAAMPEPAPKDVTVTAQVQVEFRIE
ncbi:SIMPL domain-containing protein [archaeon]|nr:SIMPL domain-containing protein [archaeon]